MTSEIINFKVSFYEKAQTTRWCGVHAKIGKLYIFSVLARSTFLRKTMSVILSILLLLQCRMPWYNNWVIHSPATVWYTCSTQAVLVSQSRGFSLVHLAKIKMKFCLSSNQVPEWGRKVIKVTLNVTWLMVPDGVAWITHNVTKLKSPQTKISASDSSLG